MTLVLAGVMWTLQLTIIPVLARDTAETWPHHAQLYRRIFRMLFWPLVVIEGGKRCRCRAPAAGGHSPVAARHQPRPAALRVDHRARHPVRRRARARGPVPSRGLRQVCAAELDPGDGVDRPVHRRTGDAAPGRPRAEFLRRAAFALAGLRRSVPDHIVGVGSRDRASDPIREPVWSPPLQGGPDAPSPPPASPARLFLCSLAVSATLLAGCSDDNGDNNGGGPAASTDYVGPHRQRPTGRPDRSTLRSPARWPLARARWPARGRRRQQRARSTRPAP